MGLPGVDWTRYNLNKETPLTLAIDLFKQIREKSPNASEMDYLFYALGGTTTRPTELDVGIFPLGQKSMDIRAERRKTLMDNIAEAVAYRYGYNPRVMGMGQVDETPREYLDRTYQLRDTQLNAGLFPDYSPLQYTPVGQDLRIGAEFHVSGEELLYDEFYQTIAAHMDGEPDAQQVAWIRHHFWKYRVGNESATYST